MEISSSSSSSSSSTTNNNNTMNDNQCELPFLITHWLTRYGHDYGHELGHELGQGQGQGHEHESNHDSGGDRNYDANRMVSIPTGGPASASASAPTLTSALVGRTGAQEEAKAKATATPSLGGGYYQGGNLCLRFNNQSQKREYYYPIDDMQGRDMEKKITGGSNTIVAHGNRTGAGIGIGTGTGTGVRKLNTNKDSNINGNVSVQVNPNINVNNNQRENQKEHQQHQCQHQHQRECQRQVKVAQAMERIRRATSELASAFSDLGAFGPTISLSFQNNNNNNSSGSESVVRNATYSDMTRRWDTIPTNHLQTLLQSSQSATNAVLSERITELTRKPISIVDAAYERWDGDSNGGHGGRSGAKANTNGASNRAGTGPLLGLGLGPKERSQEHETVVVDNSILHRPILLTTPVQVQVPVAVSASASASASTPNTTQGAAQGTTQLQTTSNQTIASNSATNTTATANVNANATHAQSETDMNNNTNTTVTIGSDYRKLDVLSANASRRYLNIRKKFLNEEKELRQLAKSLLYQKKVLHHVNEEISNFLSSETACASASASTSASTSGNTSAVASLPPSSSIPQSNMNNTTHNEIQTTNKLKSDTLVLMQNEAQRVIAQLNQKISKVSSTHNRQTKNELRIAHTVSKTLWDESMNIRGKYMDTFSYESCTYPNQNDYTISHSIKGPKRNSMLSHVIARNYGIGSELGVRGGYDDGRRGIIRRKPGMRLTNGAICQRYNALLTRRLSHVVTVNCHLYFPVYCLRFDRTGQYFVTGADDNLVKLFRLGFPHHEGKKQEQARKLGISNKRRGAVLVCSFRGHASVITDIDISSDNTLLATASEDGDVRVWAMADGCPVAILRGHAGGANMVSWSVLTPYRLVTIGEDGLARMWDIREAALKRCRSVQLRVDYTLPKLQDESFQTNESHDESHKAFSHATIEDDVILPPLPDSLENSNGGGESQPVNMNNNLVDEANVNQNRNGNNNGNGIYVPPLPVGAEHGLGAQEVGNGGLVPGAFVANDEIDEGVKLLSKLQHGELPTVEQVGAGTRSRRKKVNVTCIARCPIGGHFATGSDDGIGRIWADDDDIVLERLDDAFRDHNSMFQGESLTNLLSGQKSDSLNRTRSSSPGSSVVPSTSSLLARLHGHHKAITDMKYSNAGDRLLTASQKDGVVRVWSWGTEKGRNANGSIKIDQVRQIFLRMVPPPQCHDKTKATHSTAPSRRRSLSSSKSKLQVQCDMATWTSDDTKIITSQSCLSNTNGNDIVPGSQIIYVWDSRTGQCIIGLPSVHSTQCAVLISHPIDPSIVVSAGGDGYARVWNLNTGKCLFSHRNIHQHGSVANTSDRGKSCGYLDGSFSPDGLHLVLTDDQGRISIIDTLQSEEETKCDRDGSPQSVIPLWMREQYFANDYYELFYDSNGYCIERGSRQPPHLAPEAAMCNHTGLPYDARVQEALSMLPGPMPINEEEVRTNRDNVRIQSFEIRRTGGTLAQNVRGKRTLIEAYPSLSSYIVNGGNVGVREATGHLTAPSLTEGRSETRAPRPSTNTMSNRYRWIGYEEVLREDDGLPEGVEVESDYEEIEERSNTATPIESPTTPSRRRRRNGRNSNSSRNSGRQRRRNNRDVTRRDVERFEEVVRNEPSRTSARQSARRSLSRQYNDEDSDGSVIEEMLSANTSPGGEYIRDYTDLGHLFKIPSGGVLNREWVSRINCVDGHTGWKTYAPQVGDSVVYIPRAHSDTLQAYPICNNSSTGAPWKSWPTSNQWPIVQCEVKDIRYRFPYNGHFGRGSSNPIESIIMILSLELTGVPLIDPDRGFVWPKPEFVSRTSTRSSAILFEVSLFSSGEADFILPLGLYQWRVRQLEKAAGVNKCLIGVNVTDFYLDREKEKEDLRLDPFESQIGVVNSVEEEDEFHFQHSGCNSLMISYPDTVDTSIASPWEISVSDQKYNCPLPPCLTDAQKDIVSAILNKLEEDQYVSQTFSAPVDTRQFVDYDQMIEVPMYISKIRERLKNDYYTNIYSVRSDMKLIRDNCLKYNKIDSDVSREATNLFRTFSELFHEKLHDSATQIGSRQSLDLKIAEASSRESPDSEATPVSEIKRSSQRMGSPESQISVADSSGNNDLPREFRVKVGNDYVTGSPDEDTITNNQETVSSPEVEASGASSIDSLLHRDFNLLVKVGNHLIKSQHDSSDGSSASYSSQDESSELSETSETSEIAGKGKRKKCNNTKLRLRIKPKTKEKARDSSTKTDGQQCRTRRSARQRAQTSDTTSVSPVDLWRTGSLCGSDDGKSSQKEQHATRRSARQRAQTSDTASVSPADLRRTGSLHDTDDSKSSHEEQNRSRRSKRQNRSGHHVLTPRSPFADESSYGYFDTENISPPTDEDRETSHHLMYSEKERKRVSHSSPGKSASTRTRTSRRPISVSTYKDHSDSEGNDSSQEKVAMSSNIKNRRATPKSSKRKRNHTNSSMKSTEEKASVSLRRSPRKSTFETSSSLEVKTSSIKDKQQFFPKRNTRSSRRPNDTKKTTGTSQRDSQLVGNKKTRSSSRASIQAVTSYHEDSSSDVSDNDYEVVDEVVEETPQRQRTSRRRPKVESPHESATKRATRSFPGNNQLVNNKKTRSSPRASAQVISSYQEYSDSGFSDYHDEAEEEIEEETTQPRPNLRKRSKVESPEKTPRKKKKKAKRQKKIIYQLPEIYHWPPHYVKADQLKKICIAVLDKAVVNDAGGVFHKPAVELHPEIAESYRKVIHTPMDFSTIRKRIAKYRSFSEFQEDLILVFKNSCTYNKDGSEYWKYAKENWEYLDTIFTQVFEENDMALPRTYKL